MCSSVMRVRNPARLILNWFIGLSFRTQEISRGSAVRQFVKFKIGNSKEISPAVAFLAKIGQNDGHVTRRSTDVSMIVAAVNRQIFSRRGKIYRTKFAQEIEKFRMQRIVSAHRAALGVRSNVMELWTHLQKCTLDIVNSGQPNTGAIY